jgi:hypothetical protein
MKYLLFASMLASLALAPAPASAGDSCDEGCTPGYWKNHLNRWDGDGVDDATTVIHAADGFNATLGVTPAQSNLPDSATLFDALQIGGGQLTALNRHTAAALASSDAGICYRFSTDEVVSIYRDGVGADDGPETIDSAKDLLESANEAGCPLGNDRGSNRFCLGGEDMCPCGNVDPAAGCANSTQSGALLSGPPVANVIGDDLVLTMTGLPRSQTVIPLMAAGVRNDPFGDGRICMGAAGLKVFRFQPINSGRQGATTLDGIVAYARNNFYVDGSPEGQILPGSTWHFQAWYQIGRAHV